jgi:histidine triad (HIT) family protein
MPTIFSRIINGEIPGNIVYWDELVTAFTDIQPLAPVHILIVPNREIATLDDVTADDEQVLGHMLVAAQRIAREQGIGESGYRVIINCKGDGGQEVFHLHMHLLGGRRLGRMLAQTE